MEVEICGSDDNYGFDDYYHCDHNGDGDGEGGGNGEGGAEGDVNHASAGEDAGGCLGALLGHLAEKKLLYSCEKCDKIRQDNVVIVMIVL